MAGNVNGTIYVFDQFEGEEVVSECLVRCQGTWTQLTPQAAWFPRHGHRLVAAPGVSRKETHSKETHIMSFHISAQGRLRNPRQRGRRHGRKPSLADTGCFFWEVSMHSTIWGHGTCPDPAANCCAMITVRCQVLVGGFGGEPDSGNCLSVLCSWAVKATASSQHVSTEMIQCRPLELC